MRLRVPINGRGERNLAGRPIRYRRDVRGAAWQPAAARRRAFDSSPAFLIPEWHLSGAQAGLLAGSGAAGYMLTVPVLATLTDRIDARKILIAGSALSALGTLLFGLFATGLWSGALFNAIAGVGFAGAYMPGPQGADRSSRARRFIPRDHALHVELLVRRRPVVSGLRSSLRKLGAGAAHSLSPPLGPLVMLSVCLLLRPVEPKPAAGAAAGFRAGVPQHAAPWVSCSATARIASSSTASEPGSWRSGPLSSRRTSDASILTPVVVSVVFSAAGHARQHSRQ
mgnify:CR=1 FL=1